MAERFVFDQLDIDLDQQRVRRDSKDIRLGRKEFAILALLLRHRNQLVPHAHLLRTVWGDSYNLDSSYLLHAAVSRLRAKLGDRPARYIVAEADLGYRFAAPAVAPSPAPPEPALGGQLPAPLTSFIGRQQELAELHALLHQPSVRLISILGPGGVGKTRLASELAAQAAPLFSAGAHLVELAALSDPALLASTLLHNLALPSGSQPDPLEQLKTALGSRHLLLLLDNFEHLVAGGALVTELLRAAPRLTVITTSREALRVYGEHCYELRPFPATAPGATLEATQHPALALFVERAQAVAAGLPLDPAALELYARLCALLDGLPLAIELAASQCSQLAPFQLLQRLEQQLPLPLPGQRDRPARHQTLQAVIDWSYRLLAPAEQALFVRLGIFVGNFDLAAVAAVTQLPPGELEVLLGLLCQKHLIRPHSASDGSRGFTMLATIRSAALTRLQQTADYASVAQAHRQYYLEFITAHADKLAQADQQYWLEQFRQHYPNMRETLRASIAMGDFRGAGRLGAALWVFWYRADLSQEGRTWTQTLLAHSAALDPDDQIMLLRADSTFSRNQGNSAAALGALEQALAIAQAHGRIQFIAALLNGMGLLYKRIGRLEEAHAAFVESLVHMEHNGTSTKTAVILSNLGEVCRALAWYDQAQTHLEAALADSQSSTDRYLSANILNSLGLLEYEQARYPQALELFRQGLAIHQQLQSKRGCAMVSLNLGDTLCQLSQFDAALHKYLEACSLSQALADPHFISYTALRLARVYRLLNNAEQARNSLHTTLRLTQQHDLHGILTLALLELAELEYASAAAAQAAWYGGLAQQAFERHGGQLDAYDQRLYQQQLAHLRDHLAAHAETWLAGQTTPWAIVMAQLPR